MAFAVSTAFAQPGPFRTEDPHLSVPGSIGARLGLEIGSELEYPASGLSGAAFRFPAE